MEYQPRYTSAHALIIGIDTYTDARFMPLGAAETDAKTLAATLVNPPFSFKVRTLLGAEATKTAIQDALFDLQTTGPDDRVLVYFAGHGYTLRDRFDKEIGYFACYDTLLARHHTALKMEEITDLRRHTNAKHAAFVFDACFSGQALGLTRAQTVETAADKLMLKRAYQVLSAGAGDETVSDYNSMTELFNQILCELAESNELLTFNTLGYRIQRAMLARTNQLQIPQYGPLEGSQGGDFIFYIPDQKPKQEVVESKPISEKTVEVSQGSNLPAGEMLGQYQIIEKIGQGGLTTVYLAYQMLMDRKVVIKVLPAYFLHDPNFLERFRREARVLASLEHARIAAVHDYGEFNGCPYLVMKYMEGGSLDAHIMDYGQMEPNSTIKIVEQVAEGLDYAHGKGVIHRDFKPSNVLFEQYNAVITDFGLSLIGSTAARTGSSIVGTPAYMAPEFGRGGLITRAVDIYALGVTLYQMLTGELPYHAEEPVQVLMAHLMEPIPDVRAIRPHLPADVSLVVKTAMAKDPAERYETATALASALRDATGE